MTEFHEEVGSKDEAFDRAASILRNMLDKSMAEQLPTFIFSMDEDGSIKSAQVAESTQVGDMLPGIIGCLGTTLAISMEDKNPPEGTSLVFSVLLFVFQQVLTLNPDINPTTAAKMFVEAATLVQSERRPAMNSFH